MATIEKAQLAKKRLRETIGMPYWLRGIGLGFDEQGGYRVVVNVSALSSSVRAMIPSEFEGVGVTVEEVGEVEAQ